MIHFPETPIISDGFNGLTSWEPMRAKLVELFYPAHQEDAQKRYDQHDQRLGVGGFIHSEYTTKNLDPQLKFAFVSVVSRVQGSEVWVETFALSMPEFANYIQAQAALRTAHNPATPIQ